MILQRGGDAKGLEIHVGYLKTGCTNQKPIWKSTRVIRPNIDFSSVTIEK